MSGSLLRIGIVSVSDRASSGVYEDKGIPGLLDWLGAALTTPWEPVTRLIPDEQSLIERTLIELCDEHGCGLVLTTGGTGPAPRDVTPDATLAVAARELPGFGEQMRAVSLQYVPTAILSRQVGAVRGQSLILNLPTGRLNAAGQPGSSVDVALQLLDHGALVLHGRPHHIADRQHSGQPTAVNHRQMADVHPGHRLHTVLRRVGRLHRLQRAGHHRAHRSLQINRFVDDAPNEIALGDDADQLTALHHGQSADSALDHQFHGGLQRGVRTDGDQ
ncbi:MAG: molybdopterin adenylyltransferase [Betaproteobacteria bacterium]|nr:molybdopterin adenylyltransferase [Betaproteobacteria bacterium]